MEPAEVLRLLARRWLVIAAAVVVGLVAGYVTAPGASDAPDEFAATATLLGNPRATAQLNLEQAALLATTGDVPVRSPNGSGWLLRHPASAAVLHGRYRNRLRLRPQHASRCRHRRELSMAIGKPWSRRSAVEACAHPTRSPSEHCSPAASARSSA